MSLGTDVAPATADSELAPVVADTPADTSSPAPADAPPAEGSAPSPEALPESEVSETSPEPGTTETPPEEPEPDLSTYDPFTFRAEGQAMEYTGAVQDDDGNVLFTPEAVQQLKQDLAYARAYPRRDADAQRELAREQSARQAAEATVQTVLGKLEQLFEQSQEATTLEELIQTPLGQWVLARHAEWPRLRAEGLQKGFDMRSKAMEAELTQFRNRELDAQQRPMMLGRVEEAVRHWGPEAGLDARAQEALIRRFSTNEMLDVIFPRAPQDDPVSGMRAGQRSENLEVIRQELLLLHGLLQGRTPAQAAVAVKEENARRQGQAGSPPPPVAGTGRRTGPAPAKTPPYKTTREADDAIWK